MDTHYTAGVQVPRSDLAATLRQCNAISKSPIEDYVLLRPEPDDGHVVVQCRAVRSNHAATAIVNAKPLGELPGDPIRLNLSFLTTFVNVLADDAVNLWWSNRPDTPARIETSQDPATYWIMPMWDTEASTHADDATEQTADDDP
jgi:hypothetical protein